MACGGGSSSPSSYPVVETPGKPIIGIPAVGGYPGKGATVTDPLTGFEVTRMADPADLAGDYNGHQSGLSVVVYSRFSATNTTGEYYLVHGDNSTSAWVFRTADRTPVTILRFKPSLGAQSNSIGEVNEIRWDYSGNHPNRLYFVGRSLRAAHSVAGENPDMSFYSIDLDPASGTHTAPTLIRDFSADFPGLGDVRIMNDVEGDSSNDSRYWAWQVMVNDAGSAYKTAAIFAYDKAQNTILGRLQRSCTGAPAPCATIHTPHTPAPYLTRPNMVEMSPLGTRVIVHFDRAYAGHNDGDIGSAADGPRAYLPDFTDPIQFASDATHSGWAWGANGEELFVSQNNRNDWIEAVDIRTAATAACKPVNATESTPSCGIKTISQTDLDGGTYRIGYHFGKVYDRSKRGYYYMNTYDETGYTYWGKNQGLLVEINDATARASRVIRLGSTYNTYYDYRSEGSGALDFKGENIWTTANWGYTDGRGDVFRIKLPGTWSSLTAP
jgi:hypothetical protein